MFPRPSQRNSQFLVLAAAIAAAASAPGGLRGPETAAPAAASQPPPSAATDSGPASALGDDPAPRLSLDPAPRAQGLEATPGGARCRQDCAETRYLCRAGQDQACDPAWSQCVAACPDASPDAL